MRIAINGEFYDVSAAEQSAYWATGKLPDSLKSKFPQLANGKPVRNEYEAYWAAQPAEVQALMDISDVYQKEQLGHELADKGYKIDVPIMLWGWDPLSTMVVRRNQGFTWVPSANMNPVAVAPGINFPGLPSYDAKNIPDDGILVTIQWAKGFENTSPWMQGTKVELF